jgi:hypothetical protein
MRLAALVCGLALFCGLSTGSAQGGATTGTLLPFTHNDYGHGVWVAVDPVAKHVFVSGGPGYSSIVVTDYNGTIVKTITGEPGASQMAVDTADHTLYVALHDTADVSEIDTTTLAETARFSTEPWPNPLGLAVAGGKLWIASDGGGPSPFAVANLNGSGLMDAGLPAGGTGASLLTSGGTGDDLLGLGFTGVSPAGLSVYNVGSGSPTLVGANSDPPGSPSNLQDVSFDASGTHLLVAAGYPYQIESYTTTTFELTIGYPIGSNPTAVAATADGAYVAAGNSGGAADVAVYPVGNEEALRTWNLGGGVEQHSMVFTSDSSRLFAVIADNTGHLYLHALDNPTAVLPQVTLAAHVGKRKARHGRFLHAKIALTAQMSPATTGEVLGFTIQRLKQGHWSTVTRASRPLDTQNAAQMSVKTSHTGRYRAQATFAGDTTHAAANSGWTNFRVR